MPSSAPWLIHRGRRKTSDGPHDARHAGGDAGRTSHGSGELHARVAVGRCREMVRAATSYVRSGRPRSPASPGRSSSPRSGSSASRRSSTRAERCWRKLAVSETWVVNASPVIALAKADQLHLLHDLCKEVLVPEAVVAEILAGPPSDPARQALECGWGLPVAPRSIDPGRSNGA